VLKSLECCLSYLSTKCRTYPFPHPYVPHAWTPNFLFHPPNNIWLGVQIISSSLCSLLQSPVCLSILRLNTSLTMMHGQSLYWYAMMHGQSLYWYAMMHGQSLYWYAMMHGQQKLTMKLLFQLTRIANRRVTYAELSRGQITWHDIPSTFVIDFSIKANSYGWRLLRNRKVIMLFLLGLYPLEQGWVVWFCSTAGRVYWQWQWAEKPEQLYS
jgi:hypothetical protein